MPESPQEEQLLQRIDEGLRDAVGARNLNWSQATRVKRQKYTNMALDRFLSDSEESQSPVTRSWFKYGETQPLSPAGPDPLDLSSPDGPALSENTNSGEYPDQSDSIYEMKQTDFMQFFLHEAESPPLDKRHWNLPDLEFLDIYYESHAPADLAGVYRSNVQLRRILTEAKEMITEIYDNRVRLFAEGDDASLPSLEEHQYYQKSGHAAIELRLAMRQHDDLFEESLEPIRQCTDLIENVLMQLEQLPRTELVRPHSRLLQELEDFYDSTAWLLAAYEMSEHTAEGPYSETLETVATRNFEILLDVFSDELERVRAECARYDLLPRPSDFPSHDDDPEATVDQFMKIVDSPSENE